MYMLQYSEANKRIQKVMAVGWVCDNLGYSLSIKMEKKKFNKLNKDL